MPRDARVFLRFDQREFKTAGICPVAAAAGKSGKEDHSSDRECDVGAHGRRLIMVLRTPTYCNWKLGTPQAMAELVACLLAVEIRSFRSWLQIGCRLFPGYWVSCCGKVQCHRE